MGIAAIALVGCSSSNKQPGGGTLRFGTSVPLGSGLDPQVQSGTGLSIVARVYGYLFHVDPRDDAVILDHASSVEQPDSTTYLVRLRDDVRFHDVTPARDRAVTAHDVALSIARYRDNPLVVNKTWHTAVLDRAEAIDDRTLRVTTKRPYVYTLHALGDITAGAIFPRESIEGKVDATSGGPGSGPFLFGKRTPPKRIALSRFDAYRDPANLEGMDWQIFSNGEDPLTALAAKAIDILTCRDKSEWDRAARASNDIVAHRQPSLSSLSLGMNVTRPPFADARVRRAVDLIIDRQRLIDQIAFGDADPVGPVNEHLADGFWALTRQEVAQAQGGPLSFDDRLSEARRLLEAAGAVDAPFSLQVADDAQLGDVAAAIAADLRRGGLFPIIQPLPLLPWFVNFRGGDFGMTLISHLPYESPDSPMRFYHSAGVDATTNPFGFGDDAIDRLVERSWTEPERETRRDALLGAQRLAIESRPMVHLFSGASYSAAWNYVDDWQPDLPGSLAQYDYGQSLNLPVTGRPD